MSLGRFRGVLGPPPGVVSDGDVLDPELVAVLELESPGLMSVVDGGVVLA